MKAHPGIIYILAKLRGVLLVFGAEFILGLPVNLTWLMDQRGDQREIQENMADRPHIPASFVISFPPLITFNQL